MNLRNLSYELAQLSWGGREKQKKGKLDTSHRYDLLPLLPSGPGGIQRELVVYDLPDAKILKISLRQKFFEDSYSRTRLSKMKGRMSSILSNFQIFREPTRSTSIGCPLFF